MGPELEQPDERALDLIRWKEAGFKGSFYAVTCYSAWIGSYKVAPTDRVLFSSEGIMIEVPILNADGKPSSKETVKLALSKPQILKLDVHYGKSIPALFIYLTPMASRTVREILKMTRNDSYIWFDVLSNDETHKRITLLPEHVTDEVKYGMKQAFSVIGVYSGIGSAETNRILILSSPPEVRALAETSANQEMELNIPSPQGNGVICQYCGYVSFFLNKCQHCSQTFLKLVKVPAKPTGSNSNRKFPNPIKSIDLFPTSKVTSTKPSESENIVPKNVKDQELVTKSLQTVPRKNKAISEINEEPEAKKSRKEVLDPNPELGRKSYQQLRDESCSAVDDWIELQNHALDLMKCKEAGLKGNFFPVSCHSVWIGSYGVTPIGRILISQEGIVIQVPVLLNGKPHPSVNTKFVLTKADIMTLNVHFGQSIPSIFIYLTPAGNGEIEKRLKCNESGARFDIFGQNEKQKRIVLMLDCVTDEAKQKMMEAFTVLTLCVEISAQQANRILMLSAPPRSEQETEQPDDKLLNMKKWKDAGMNGRTYLTVKCRFAWIGSYRVIPVGWILLSAEGILMEIPVMNADGTPSAEETVTLTFFKSQILEAEADFTRKDLPAIFIYPTSVAAKEVRSRLQMTHSCPDIRIDSNSSNKLKRKIILFPDQLTDEVANGIKNAFRKMGVYNEVTGTETIDMLISSCYSV